MSSWYERDDIKDQNVICSRVRLSRNWSEYVFPSRLSDEKSKEMIARLEDGLRNLGDCDGREYVSAHIEDFNDVERRLLLERRILNPSIYAKKAPMGLLLSKEEDVSVVLNGTDHIRIQAIVSGNGLKDAYDTANKVDDYIGSRFSYAFDEKYGFLTSYPTNVGTGMRASVLLHLPYLSRGRNFSALLNDMGRFGVEMRGVYGDGKEIYGSIYEISNQKTLGQTEDNIINLVNNVALRLNTQESSVRSLALKNNRIQREDEVYKSYGVLKYAKTLSIKETMIYLSQLMSGVTDGIIKFKEDCSLFSLMLGVQTSNLMMLAEKPLSDAELDEARADFIRDKLPELAE